MNTIVLLNFFEKLTSYKKRPISCKMFEQAWIMAAISGRSKMTTPADMR